MSRVAKVTGFLLYSTALIAPTLYYLQLKISADAGGFSSRYSPLIVAILLITITVVEKRHKPLLHPVLWRIVFWLLAVAFAAAYLFSGYMVFSASSDAVLLRFIGILCWLVIAMPAMTCLYRYSDPKAALWTGKASA